MLRFGVPPCPSPARTAPDDVFLLSYFTDKDEGREGLKLARSDDGYVFRALGNGRGFLTPMVGENRLMRDPNLVQGPDGLWHLVWTSDWFGPVIGHATSRDLMHWSPQQTIPVMKGFVGVRNSWAPEAIYDRARGDFVIMWSSSIDGRFGATAGEKFAGIKLRPLLYAHQGFPYVHTDQVAVRSRYRLDRLHLAEADRRRVAADLQGRDARHRDAAVAGEPVRGLADRSVRAGQRAVHQTDDGGTDGDTARRPQHGLLRRVRAASLRRRIDHGLCPLDRRKRAHPVSRERAPRHGRPRASRLCRQDRVMPAIRHGQNAIITLPRCPAAAK
ncbi:hypothetical protein NHF48_004290 [Sphingomonas sp. H160509]|uniref:hypothetical protein n=1 Tax=Sphingomonas sp. H160509 TaxID=2955313 RepID=UPI0020974465|nr:hypothetical protein [Sphingomonas sp. H160509]MDD1450386.1 hypothetical protein [Sphingomonas sp. H160509]